MKRRTVAIIVGDRDSLIVDSARARIFAYESSNGADYFDISPPLSSNVTVRAREFFSLRHLDRRRALLKGTFAILYDAPARNGGSITIVREFQGFFVTFERVSSRGGGGERGD